jgi:hypothetical protein
MAASGWLWFVFVFLYFMSCSLVPRAETLLVQHCDEGVSLVLKHFWACFKSGMPASGPQLEKMRKLADKLAVYQDDTITVRPQVFNLQKQYSSADAVGT